MSIPKRVAGMALLGTILMFPGVKAEAPRGASFEDVHAVKLPKRKFGYRGAMGDIEVLRDGRLLMAYTVDDVGILARYSRDQGRSWGPDSG
jgi:hypothetical protein